MNISEHTLKITDEEREMAYELRWMVEGILMERERYVLYREAYMQSRRDGLTHEMAYRNARVAIESMEKAFMPICDACEGEERASQPKVN
jgi:hypothetical protein